MHGTDFKSKTVKRYSSLHINLGENSKTRIFERNAFSTSQPSPGSQLTSSDQFQPGNWEISLCYQTWAHPLSSLSISHQEEQNS
jgi:hypothetical protein